MKYIIYLTLCLTLSLMASCTKDDPVNDASLDLRDITMGPEGGVQQIRVAASGKWVATSSEPWVLISPANGEGPTICQIKTDSTLLAGAARKASVRFAMQQVSEQYLVNITQEGFDKELAVSQTEFEVASYGAFKKRYFEVEITSNVRFEVVIPKEAAWLTYEKFDFVLERGARPRRVKVRFNWDSNTNPETRETHVEFKTSEDDMSRLDGITVRQGQAPQITDDRAGDSLALITIQRNLGCRDLWDYSESMIYWSGVTLWEEGDQGATEENLGRVRSARFQFFYLKESLPTEIRYLKHAETISFFSNANAFLQSLDPGKEITMLTNLKELQLFSIGLTSLPAEFTNLKNLESLDLSGNNFNEVPVILTSENFPKLRYLSMISNRRYPQEDLTVETAPKEKWGGLLGDESFPERLLRWDSLEVLRLSNNLIHGRIPDMKGYKTYSQLEVERDTLPGSSRSEYKGPYTMVGKPKVLPSCKLLNVNLNYLTGELPEWLLHHPHLMEWDASKLVFPQIGACGIGGSLPGFSNIPETPDYYYELYPHKKPDYYDKN